MKNTIGDKRLAVSRWACKPANHERGIIIVITALIFPVLLAFMGLALDVGLILDKKRRQQKAADAAAFGGAHEVFRANSPLVTKAARNDAAINGFPHKDLPSIGDSDVTVTVNYPYTYKGSTSFVEMIIEEVNVPTYFLKVVGSQAATVQSRAVAGLVKNYDGACILALNPTMGQALKVAGQGVVQANCGVMANSNEPTKALNLTGQACLTSTTWIGTAGGFSAGGVTAQGQGCPYSPQPTTQALPMYDPMKYMAQPPIPLPTNPLFGDVQVGSALCEDEPPNPAFSCNSGTYEWNPGQYGRLKATSGNHLFTAGIYVINQEMDFTTGGTISGTEVGFYGTEVGGSSSWMGISVTSQSAIDLSAPTSGPMKGILVWVDRYAPYKTVKFEGGVTSRWKGTFYVPSQHLDFGGHTNAQGDWVYIIADNIDVHGQGAVTQFNGPDGSTPGAPDIFQVTMVE